ncbi:MAG: type II toxin-antitoxin system VapC family toxin [Chloroflexota bacterium]
MSRFLLDTTTLIDLSKGREPATSAVFSLIERGDELGVCAVNVAEFFTGVPPAERSIWTEFFSLLDFWPITPAAGRRAGIWRHDYGRQGLTLSSTDTLIAAVASENNAVVLTRNVKDFPMPEISARPTP